MLRIHQALQGGDFPYAANLVRELEVASKTIHRDLEFMRDRLDLPIAYDGARFGYHHTDEVNTFPTLHTTEGELVSLVVAEKALQQYRGTTFERPLLSAIKRWSSHCPTPSRSIFPILTGRYPFVPASSRFST